MHTLPIGRTHRLSTALLALVLGAGLAACGGGDTTESLGEHPMAMNTAGQTQAAAGHTRPPVAVQGCVLDSHFIPATGVPVRALGVDGRLLGNAQSNGQGHFTLHLPAATDVLLQVDRPEGETLRLRVGHSSQRWDTCLQDDQA